MVNITQKKLLLNLCDLWISVGNTPRWIEKRRDRNDHTEHPDREDHQQHLTLRPMSKYFHYLIQKLKNSILPKSYVCYWSCDSPRKHQTFMIRK